MLIQHPFLKQPAGLGSSRGPKIVPGICLVPALRGLLAVFALVLFASVASAAPAIDPLLSSRVAAAPFARTPVIITYTQRPSASDFLALRVLGITGGVVLSELPMVLTTVNATQLDALSRRSNIVSLYANRTLRLSTNASREFIGLNALLTDQEVTQQNRGLPVSGKGIGVAYVDTGIDATHPDLQLGENVAQNVLFPLAEVPLNLPAGFVPVVAVEDAPISDVEGGHGTFGAAVTAGTGAASGGLYGGIAPGAHLVGLVAGNDAGLSTFAIVQAYDYTLVNQIRYNIRVCNNSFGTTLADAPYDPFDPINVATRTMHDRNIVVVFAAGNDGDAPDMINPYSVAPWVISVAAGEKQGLGTPASFSSRGNDNGTGVDLAGQPADPLAPPNLRPDLIGSGVDIKSARSKAPGVTNVAGTIPIFVGANDLSTIPPAFLLYYTTSQGTSFSAPQVSGVVALMLEANPLLTPDEVVAILRGTATPMPYEERVVGAGYVDTHNAVRAALNLAGVAHPANLFPSTDPNTPQIADAADDQLGTTAQDIRSAHFGYDAASSRIVYTLEVVDLSVTTPNMGWTMSSNFGETTIFVSTDVNELGEFVHEYGRITTLATGTRNQESLGPAEGEIDGNRIIVRVPVADVVVAVGTEIVGSTSTSTTAQSQILIGTSFTGGLLLNSDSAAGADFVIREDNGGSEPDPEPDEEPVPSHFTERHSGATGATGTADLPVELRHPSLEAKLNYHPHNASATLQLIDSEGQVVASTAAGPLEVTGLIAGSYTFRVISSAAGSIDFVIKSTQRSE